jgi:hypothetical protein
MNQITSPFNDKLLSVKLRKEKLTFRGKQFEVNYHYYEDEGQQFTTYETDEVNLKQVYDAYDRCS